jgi:Response regulator containing CheY-like receiver, AAA-type ATPase, and DNA-binding domains
MYSRAIEMYKKSLDAHDDREDSRQVQAKLAELLIFLYGKDGFDEARGLARDCPPLAWGVDQAIKCKQTAIARREQKAMYNRDYPALKAIVGESHNILEICRKILAYAQSPTPVLITGDSGTGKEVVAKALAEVSGRTFNPVNCGAFAEGMLESELFGHVKGAFTDARANKKGLFERQGDAVIFLDEIGDTSPKFQVDLLRVLENREFYRVGDPLNLQKLTGSKKIVCATAKDLEAEADAARFRKDLLYRIRELTIRCEPLAKRPEDVQLLVRHFLATEPDLREYGPFSEGEIAHWIHWCRPPDTLRKNGPRATGTLSLEGNIRELRGQVRKAVLEGKFPKKGDRPFQDRWGAMTYTKEEVKRCDWEFALKVCQRQKDAGRLMGKNLKDTSKFLALLGLSKKQRKKQAPQV